MYQAAKNNNVLIENLIKKTGIYTNIRNKQQNIEYRKHFVRRNPMHATHSRLLMLTLMVLIIYATPVAAETERLPLPLNVMNTELQRNFAVLKGERTPPYYMSYSVDHVSSRSVSSSFGALLSKRDTSRAYLTIDVRVGSFALDNTHDSDCEQDFAPLKKAPVDDSPEPLAVTLWQGTDEAYKQAVEALSEVKTNRTLCVKDEDPSDDFSRANSRISIENPPGIIVDLEKWADRTRAYSAPFARYPYMLDASATFRSNFRIKYFVNTDGTKLAVPINYMQLIISATAKADDGMELPLYLSYFGYAESDFPDDSKIMADIDNLIKTLGALRRAPMVDPYTGPAILSGRASGVLFHEVLGHRLEGQRLKSEEEGQTLKKMVDQRVLPQFISVTFDPTIRELDGLKLSGYYDYDDEGTKAERVIAIQNGILKNFLMTRSPIANFPNSNGHARCQPGLRPVARQSNLIVTSKKQMSEKELRQELIRELKEQGKTFGLYFKDIQGGFTSTGRMQPNAFTVLPLVVYKIYSDGRPDELVRGVDLIGTPLTTFGKIVATGASLEVFNGMCGAESGNVPVSAVSPSILVSQIEVQKKVRSMDKPPILPPPPVDPEERR